MRHHHFHQRCDTCVCIYYIYIEHINYAALRTTQLTTLNWSRNISALLSSYTNLPIQSSVLQSFSLELHRACESFDRVKLQKFLSKCVCVCERKKERERERDVPNSSKQLNIATMARLYGPLRHPPSQYKGKGRDRFPYGPTLEYEPIGTTRKR